MADNQGWPLPMSWRNPCMKSLANEQQPEQPESEVDDSSLGGFQQLDAGYDTDSQRHLGRTHRTGGPPNRHGSTALESYASRFFPRLNSGTIPDIPDQAKQNRNTRPFINLGPDNGFGVLPAADGSDMYKDLLKRLNNMGIEISGHTDKAPNKAPGANSFTTSHGIIGEVNHGLFPSQSADQAGLAQASHFSYFGAPEIIDNSLAALLNDETDKSTAYLVSHEDIPSHLPAGHAHQTPGRSLPCQTFQSYYPEAGYPPASAHQHHCRAHSLAGPSSSLPPSCATAATFSPAGTYGHPASPVAGVPAVTTNISFKPMMMVQELQNARYHQQLQASHEPFTGANIIHAAGDPTITNFPCPTGLAAASGCSDNYKGNHFLPSNRSANIPEKDNCSFFITGLPPAIDTRILLAHIRDVGRIFASYINDANPAAGHLTSAAKLVFFEKTAAQHFWARHREQLPLMVCGYAAKVVRNRIKVAEPDWPRNYTRVVVISGRKEIVERSILLKIFEAHFVFHVDQIIEDPVEVPDIDVEQGWTLPDGWRTIEIRFGSWRSQAQTSFQVLGNHPDFRGVRIRYGRDPCDRIRDCERHLYQVCGDRLDREASPVGVFGPVGGVRLRNPSGSDRRGGEQDEEDEVWEEAQRVKIFSPLSPPPPPTFGPYGPGIVRLGSSVGSLAATPLLSNSNSQRSSSNNSSGSSGFSEIAEIQSLRAWRRTPGPPSPSHYAQKRDKEDEADSSSHSE